MAERIESPTGDRLIAESEEAEAESRAQRAANLFDLRRIIGGLFLIYGVILTVLGLTDTQAEIQKAAGVRINLWTGLAMIAVAIIFLIWAFTRPLSKQLEEAEREVEEYDRVHGRPTGDGATNGGATNGGGGDGGGGDRGAAGRGGGGGGR